MKLINIIIIYNHLIYAFKCMINELIALINKKCEIFVTHFHLLIKDCMNVLQKNIYKHIFATK